MSRCKLRRNAVRRREHILRVKMKFTVIWDRYPSGCENGAVVSKMHDFNNLEQDKTFMLGKMKAIDNLHWAGARIENNETGAYIIQLNDTKDVIAE